MRDWPCYLGWRELARFRGALSVCGTVLTCSSSRTAALGDKLSFAGARFVLSERVREGAQVARDATLAQLVEQLIRNQQVVGSNPTGGSKNTKQTLIAA